MILFTTQQYRVLFHKLFKLQLCAGQNVHVVHYANMKTFTSPKAKLLLLKLIHLFAREVLLAKKMEIEETKTT